MPQGISLVGQQSMRIKPKHPGLDKRSSTTSACPEMAAAFRPAEAWLPATRPWSTTTSCSWLHPPGMSIEFSWHFFHAPFHPFQRKTKLYKVYHLTYLQEYLNREKHQGRRKPKQSTPQKIEECLKIPPVLNWHELRKKSSYYTSHYTAFLVEILLNGLLQSLSPKSTSTLKFTVPETTKFSLLFYCFFMVLGRSKQRSVETTLAWPRSAAAANAAAADAGASPGQPIVASKPWLANTQWYLAFGQAYKIYKCSIIASIDILDILLQHIQCAKLQRWFSKVSQNSKRLQFHCFTRQSQEAKPDLIHYTSL